MKYTSAITLLFAAAGPLVACQSLSSIPVCARQAAIAAIQQSGCPISDLPCICTKISVLDALRSNIIGECSPEDQDLALKFQHEVCDGTPGQPREGVDPAPAEMPSPDMSSMSAGGDAMAAPTSSMHHEDMAAATTGAAGTCGSSTHADSSMSMMTTGMMSSPSASATGGMETDMSSMPSEESMSGTMAAPPPEFTGGAAIVAPMTFSSSASAFLVVIAAAVAGLC